MLNSAIEMPQILTRLCVLPVCPGAPPAKIPAEVATAAVAGVESAVLGWLECGGQVNAVDHRQATLLMIVSETGHEPLVGSLLSLGASIELRRNDGSTAMMIAAMNGHRQCVRRLVVQRSRLSSQPPSAPLEAARAAPLIPEWAMEFRMSERWRI